MRCAKILLLVLLLAWLSLMFWNTAKPLPPGTHLVSQTARLSDADVDFLYESPRRRAAAAPDLSAIDHAEQLIVLDRSPVTRELAQRLLARKHLRPHLKIVLVTDPANEAFGGSPAQTLTSLEQAGVIVARVRLDRLRDSNPLYSGLWRLAFGWWSDPFDETPGRATLPALARTRNSKSDQRQLVVADDGSGGWIAIIAPAGADASLPLRGPLARAIIAGELQVAAWSTDDDRLPVGPSMDDRGVGSIDARFLTEGAIETALLDAIAAAGSGDRLGIAVENFSERRLIAAALRAAARGASLQVLLARNREPNQAVADELLRGGGRIEIRWYLGSDAASLPKLLLFRHGDDVWMNLGTANYTRRNLGDLNLAASVELRMPVRAAAARAVTEYFSEVWSVAATEPKFAAASAADYWHYRFAEASGLSSF
ncbi:MAG TPA: phospholipase D-like domain-containing protein [Steroidobacteraceae bacterium]